MTSRGGPAGLDDRQALPLDAPAFKRQERVWMTRTLKYEPIDCELHDVLEMHATSRKQASIRFQDQAGAIHQRDAAIVDIFASEGAEYLVLSSGERLRLDQLLQVGHTMFTGGKVAPDDAAQDPGCPPRGASGACRSC